jgi:hypothetical protein
VNLGFKTNLFLVSMCITSLFYVLINTKIGKKILSTFLVSSLLCIFYKYFLWDIIKDSDILEYFIYSITVTIGIINGDIVYSYLDKIPMGITEVNNKNINSIINRAKGLSINMMESSNNPSSSRSNEIPEASGSGTRKRKSNVLSEEQHKSGEQPKPKKARFDTTEPLSSPLRNDIRQTSNLQFLGDPDRIRRVLDDFLQSNGDKYKPLPSPDDPAYYSGHFRNSNPTQHCIMPELHHTSLTHAFQTKNKDCVLFPWSNKLCGLYKGSHIPNLEARGNTEQTFDLVRFRTTSNSILILLNILDSVQIDLKRYLETYPEMRRVLIYNYDERWRKDLELIIALDHSISGESTLIKDKDLSFNKLAYKLQTVRRRNLINYNVISFYINGYIMSTFPPSLEDKNLILAKETELTNQLKAAVLSQEIKIIPFSNTTRD